MKKLVLFVLIISCGKTFPESELAPEHRSPTVIEESLEWAKVMAGSVGAACLYGIAHDQVAVQVCPEFFSSDYMKGIVLGWREGWQNDVSTVTESPAKIAFLWGVHDAWRRGVYSSIPLVLASRVGPWPKLSTKDLIRPTAVSLGVLGLCTFLIGYKHYRHAGTVRVGEVLDDVSARNVGVVAALNAAYIGGPISVAGLSSWILYKRYRKHFNLLKKKEKRLLDGNFNEFQKQFALNRISGDHL